MIIDDDDDVAILYRLGLGGCVNVWRGSSFHEC